MNQTAVWEYNKGKVCKYTYVLCQEGYCLRCGIYNRAVTETSRPKKARGRTRNDYIYRIDSHGDISN